MNGFFHICDGEHLFGKNNDVTDNGHILVKMKENESYGLSFDFC